MPPTDLNTARKLLRNGLKAAEAASNRLRDQAKVLAAAGMLTAAGLGAGGADAEVRAYYPGMEHSVPMVRAQGRGYSAQPGQQLAMSVPVTSAKQVRGDPTQCVVVTPEGQWDDSRKRRETPQRIVQILGAGLGLLAGDKLGGGDVGKVAGAVAGGVLGDAVADDRYRAQRHSRSEAMRAARERCEAQAQRNVIWEVSYVDPSNGTHTTARFDQPPVVADGRMSVYVMGDAATLGLADAQRQRSHSAWAQQMSYGQGAQAQAPSIALETHSGTVQVERRSAFDAALAAEIKNDGKMRLAVELINDHRLPFLAHKPAPSDPPGLVGLQHMSKAASEAFYEDFIRAFAPGWEPERGVRMAAPELNEGGALVAKAAQRMAEREPAQRSMVASMYVMAKWVDVLPPQRAEVLRADLRERGLAPMVRALNESISDDVGNVAEIDRMVAHDVDLARAVSRYERILNQEGTDVDRVAAVLSEVEADVVAQNRGFAAEVHQEIKAERRQSREAEQRSILHAGNDRGPSGPDARI